MDPGACSSSLYVKLPIMILSVPVNYPSTNQSNPMENPIGPIGLSVGEYFNDIKTVSKHGLSNNFF